MTPERCPEEEEEELLLSLRSLVADDADEIDARLAEYLSALRAWAVELLKLDALSSEWWDWAEDIEAIARETAEDMAEQAEEMRRGAAALSSLRSGEEAHVVSLRKRAAFSDALGADAADVAAAARRLQEKELRRVAAQEDVVTHQMAGFLGYIAAETDALLETGHVPTPDDLEAAARVDGSASGKEQRMATLAARLTRGAAAFAARPGEEPLVAALRRQAANADAARATVEAFRASVRRVQAAAGRSAGHARM
ncbi:hypothetical protein QOZ80_2BG0171540 [Eleusine coracana subsp. coracana]|nr:hypothetical protein QOZ80_2BG0171540 [Eleusine coracana subsp. coracana]